MKGHTDRHSFGEAAERQSEFVTLNTILTSVLIFLSKPSQLSMVKYDVCLTRSDVYQSHETCYFALYR